MVHGSRPVLSVAFFAGLITISVGLFVGLLAGFRSGITDSILTFITDVALTIPGVPLARASVLLNSRS